MLKVINKILVPTDGSEYSKHALAAALQYAEQYQSKIKLIHVVHQPISSMTVSAEIYSFSLTEEQINEIGNTIMEKTLVGNDISKVSIEKEISEGYPATVILDEIKEGIDLVVMGTSGHGPLAGALIGSVTQRVLADATCPVLIVK
ncbi:universal stress protein UspA-like protein [Desulfosporosinus orientis DSM 765]|uniref:Universal stress protein UspA-like protein n=1 Tax=Desulfosporosinus orientis (strain ATCC 19365 / DSM 765 / NCIMB 8382 / VKM B-1628 / Singapore I) TaxID=768706 RepID=G7WID0_DESOD|nr:universal stress protein [Desulfosporosinus orientis]AET68578.1 universal stress protein UspA-like protein [Desulfosporosinus orientis DSM 765]